MASPMVTPRRQRSIAGPIVLILLGVLFLLMTMGVLDRYSLATIFARYWPLLLILWGVIKLIEHQQAKQAGLPARGIGAGGVFLVLFIVCIGLMATQFVRVWPNIKDHIQIGDNEDFEDLFEIGFGVGIDLLAGKRRARFRLSGGVADQRREIPNQENSRVAQILKMFQLADDYRVAEVNVGSGGVHTELGAEGLAGLA